MKSATIHNCNNVYRAPDGSTHIYPCVRVRLRNGPMVITRRFSASRFGTISNARSEARAFVNYAMKVHQGGFWTLLRGRGRPRHSDYYATVSVHPSTFGVVKHVIPAARKKASASKGAPAWDMSYVRHTVPMSYQC